MKAKAIFYYPSQVTIHQLPDKGTFIVDNKTNEILQNGYSMTPMAKAKWIETVSDIIETVFHGNVAQASEVLSQVYKKPEYQRTKLYELLPKLRYTNTQWKQLPKTVRRWIDRELDKVYARGLEEQFFVRHIRRRTQKVIETAPVGTSQCKWQLGTVEKRFRKKAFEKICGQESQNQQQVS
jgi:hypothetical protein